VALRTDEGHLSESRNIDGSGGLGDLACACGRKPLLAARRGDQPVRELTRTHRRTGQKTEDAEGEQGVVRPDATDNQGKRREGEGQQVGIHTPRGYSLPVLVGAQQGRERESGREPACDARHDGLRGHAQVHEQDVRGDTHEREEHASSLRPEVDLTEGKRTASHGE
jgi:hypothetical protein